ncbi:MAG TPA: DUF4340 domain-containing protein [Polyangiaceae bacterium]|nr:DUF4340 domain-containing protein [Polyangiaceae bacterium]
MNAALRPAVLRLLTNWLLVVAAAIAAILVVVTREVPSTGELSERERSLLKVFDEHQISRIEIEAKGKSFVLARVVTAHPTDPDDESGDQGPNQAFRLIAPIEEQANPEKIKALLSTLQYASFVRPVADAQIDRKSLGLEDPRWVIHVDQGPIHYRLRLGGNAPAPFGASYLEVTGENAPGKGIFVVRQGLVEPLSVTVEDFRSHELAAIGKDSLTQIQFSQGQNRWTLRNDAGRYRFAGMQGNQLAARDAVDHFFLQLARIKFENFLSDADLKGKLDPPEISMILTPKDGATKPITLQLGAACPGHEEWRIAARESSERVTGCVSRALVDDLNLDAASLVEHHIFALHPDEVETLTLKRGDASLTLERSANGYRMTSPAQGDVERPVADDRVRAWLDLSGEQAPADSTNFEATASITLHGVSDIADRYREQRVEFGPLEEGKPVLVRREVDGAVLLLPPLDLSQFEVNGLLLRSALVLDLQAKQLQHVEVASSVVQEVIEQSDEGITLASPAGFTADGVLVTHLLDALRGLRAVRWVAAADNGSFGFATPTVRVKFTETVKSNNLEDHLLRIGTSTQGGYFAQLDNDAVFVLSRQSFETIHQWVLDRSVFSSPLESVAHIDLRSAQGTVKLVGTGDHFNQQGPGPHLSRSSIDDLISALQTLRPEAALHLGTPPANEGFSHPILTLVAQDRANTKTLEWKIGAADVWRNVSIYYARIEGINATYAIARGPVDRILDAL